MGGKKKVLTQRKRRSVDRRGEREREREELCYVAECMWTPERRANM